jgi:NAD-dependent dihydropyrimidine dehydrogenase PreA subunit
MKTLRKIIEIDENLCDGCGQCVTSCAEGALKIVDGKAKVIAEIFCDGLGACIGECPRAALKIIEREADPFDEHAVEEHMKGSNPVSPHTPPQGGCPGSRMQTFKTSCCDNISPSARGTGSSALTHWPVQISLVSPSAPFLKGAHLLIAADCTAFAYPDFHGGLLAGKVLMVGCPKLDDGQAYLNKFADIFKNAGVKKVTVAEMEVPCCSKLPTIVKKAMEMAGACIPMEEVVIGIQGDIKNEDTVLINTGGAPIDLRDVVN